MFPPWPPRPSSSAVSSHPLNRLLSLLARSREESFGRVEACEWVGQSAEGAHGGGSALAGLSVVPPLCGPEGASDEGESWRIGSVGVPEPPEPFHESRLDISQDHVVSWRRYIIMHGGQLMRRQTLVEGTSLCAPRPLC